jgi:hypothetical protein
VKASGVKVEVQVIKVDIKTGGVERRDLVARRGGSRILVLDHRKLRKRSDVA